jgi:hypothetical protein
MPKAPPGDFAPSSKESKMPIAGFPELLPGFEWRDIDADGVRIRTAVGGMGRLSS